MTAPHASTAPFFEAKYSGQSDPWNFAASPYELKRYDAIIAALNHRRYASMFEPGCSVGVLTERLAAWSDRVIAMDFSPSAVAQAAARCARFAGVSVQCGSLDEHADVRGFDLIVLSEIGYYFEAHAWRAFSAQMVECMDVGTTVLAAHWLGNSKDHCLHGDTVHAILRGDCRLGLTHAARHAGFRVDRWVRR